MSVRKSPSPHTFDRDRIGASEPTVERTRAWRCAVLPIEMEINHKEYIVRLMMNETPTPAKVVTVYRTSKITK